MLRALILLLLIFCIGILAAPFLLSSRAIDDRGITLSGRIVSKSETVTVHYSDWKRSAEVTLRYDPPDTHTAAFFGVNLSPGQYDALHIGDTVKLHYLRQRDVPAVPLARVLRQMHALPSVRLADRRAFTNFEQFLTPKVIYALAAIAGVAVLLLLLRTAGSPLFGWVLGVSLAAAFALLMLYDFPRPTPAPVVDVRQASGTVKSMDRIDRMFAGNRSRDFIADQPVDVVGIEFVPYGRVESVVAVDLIDAGSVPGLKANSTVSLGYEGTAPRTAHIVPATRNFVSRNIHGMLVESALSLAVLILFYAAAHWIGLAFNRLVRKNDNSRRGP